MSGTVLLLEDEPVLSDMLVCLLTDDGHRVEVCASPAHLIERAAEAPGALAVVDFWGQSHRCLIDEERAQVIRLAQAVPTILVTGRTWAANASQQELGLLGLVMKPFDIDALTAFVSDCFARLKRGVDA